MLQMQQSSNYNFDRKNYTNQVDTPQYVASHIVHFNEGHNIASCMAGDTARYVRRCMEVLNVTVVFLVIVKIALVDVYINPCCY